MKILLINDQFEHGGAGRVAAIMANELFNRGYEVVVITDLENYKNNYPLLQNIPICRISIAPVSTLLKKIIKWAKCIKDIRKYIKSENPDIIIAVQSFMFLCAYFANLVSDRKPIIVADHTSFNRKSGLLLDFVRFHLYSKASGLSILTQKDYKLLGPKFPNKRVIYNPLPFPILNRDVPKRKNILCVGRLDVWEIKGFDIIFRIWSKINIKYFDWILEIAGEGSQASIEYLHKLLEQYGLSGRVKLLGHVTDMQTLYSETSIFALPSRMEGFPMSLMEAMSQGCACVAFSVWGACNEMMSEKAGIIVNDGNEVDFAKALESLIIDETKRKKYSVDAMSEVEKFSISSFVNNWENFIKDVLEYESNR